MKLCLQDLALNIRAKKNKKIGEMSETITIEQHPLIKKMQEDFNKQGGIKIAEGAFGDMDNCAAIVEEIFIPPTGETGSSYVKYYGCDFKLKGYPEKGAVEGFGLPKAMVSVLPREIVYRSWTLQLSLLFLFIFRRKKFIELVDSYFAMIYRHTNQRLGIRWDRYSAPIQEIRRAFYVALNQEIYKRGLMLPGRFLDHGEFGLLKDRNYFNFLSNVMEFFCLLFELDSAYRFRVQDIFGELNKNNLKQGFFKEINRLFKLELSREVVSQDGLDNKKEVPGMVRTKIKIIGYMVKAFLILSPFSKRVLKDFLLNLDISKVKLDEDDWYFCLRRQQYNFKGISLEERLKEKERIDTERKHIMLKIVPDGKGGLQIGI